MPKVLFQTKELQKVLKNVNTFTDLSIKKRYSLSIDSSTQTVYHTNEVATLVMKPSLEVLDDSGTNFVTVDASFLSKLKLPSDTTTIEWGIEKSSIQVKSGRFSSKMSIVMSDAEIPNKDYMPEFSIKTSLGKMKKLVGYAEIPYSFYKQKTELAPVKFFARDGKLVVNGDDGYSLLQVKSDIESSNGLEFVVPRIALKSIFKDSLAKDEDEVSLESYGMSIILSDGINKLYMSQVGEEVANFEEVLNKNNSQWMVYCQVNPKELLKGIKPLVSLISAKDQSKSYVQTIFKKPSDLKLVLQHEKMEETKFDGIPLLSEITTSNNISKYTLNMHPTAFVEFTGLVSGLEMMEWSGNDRVSYYEGAQEGLLVQYLFPVVSL